MYTLERLLADALSHRGPLSTREGTDYQQVWDAFNRYITDTIERRQTLSVPSFCKIGWRVEERLHQGRARLRPHFQLSEGFVRAHGIDPKSQHMLSDQYLVGIEELNFSKAAIRFSQNLTKDNFFMGLRALVQLIGAAASTGHQISLDFEVGRLLCMERGMTFVFQADLYLMEGLEVPSEAVRGADYRPSNTFVAPSREVMEGLTLQGTNQPVTVKATALGGWSDSSAAPAPNHDERAAPPSGGLASSGLSGKESTHLAALGRHLAQLEQEAEAVMVEKEEWEDHLEHCVATEDMLKSRRKAAAMDNAGQLREQMVTAEEKRMAARELAVQQASLHDFPSFRDAPEADFIAFNNHRRENLKEDLDKEVAAREATRLAARDRELAEDKFHIQATKRDMARLRHVAAQKKVLEKEALVNSWEGDMRLREVRRAVDGHARKPAAVCKLHDLMEDEVRPGLQSLGLSPLTTPRVDRGLAAARPVTGSVRRMPIGAAASLALHKERLAKTVTPR